MKRRKFLSISLAGISAVGFSYLYFNGFDKSLGDSVFVPQFLPKIMDAHTVKEIGKEYLGKDTKEEFSKNIKEKLKLLGVDGSTSLDELNGRIREEYSAGNTIIVKGWVLSRIEVLQCAFYVVQN